MNRLMVQSARSLVPVPEESAAEVVAVVLNWNGRSMTARAIRSLLELERPRLRVVLVDNGSRDGEAAALAAEFAGPRVRVIALEKNVGFARAVNAGAMVAMRDGARFVLLFNNDARIAPTSPAIAEALAAFENEPALGAAGPTIYNDDSSGSIQSGSYSLSMWFPIPRPRRSGGELTLARSSYLSGSCLLVDVAAFAAVGGLDPDYFLYGDDVDFARRLHEAGFRERLVDAPGVTHARAASNRVGSAGYVYTALRSNLILVRKHARWYQLPTAYATCIAAGAALAALGAIGGNADAPWAVVRAFRDFVLGRWGSYDGGRLEPATRPGPVLNRAAVRAREPDAHVETAERVRVEAEDARPRRF